MIPIRPFGGVSFGAELLAVADTYTSGPQVL
jgi:hypothetical protein